MHTTRFPCKAAIVSGLALTLAGFGLAAGPAQAAPAPVPALVSPVWLNAHLHAPGQVIVEVYATDSQQDDYDAGHIPGAVFTSFFDDGWFATVDGVRGMLPPPAKIAKVIGGLGIGNDTRVILVPAGAKTSDFSGVARIFWTLRMEGQKNVSILNGGDVAWFAAPKAAVAKGDVNPKAAAFVPHPTMAYDVTLAQVKQALSTHVYQLVDARAPAQFSGKVKDGVDARAGTLPGARNLPFSAVLTKDGEGVLPMPELQAAVKQAGIAPGKPTITFCNTGHLGSTAWFVLREVFANPKVRLYDGSMTEWSAHRDLPMVNGKSAF